MLGEEHGFEWVKQNVVRCPISNSMDLLGKKFAVLILRNMLVYKQTRFKQFLETIDCINPKTLTARLRELERRGLIGRKVFPEVPPHVEYYLTEKGKALRPLLEQLATYSIQNYPDQVFRKRYNH